MIYSAALTPELGADMEQLVDLFNRVFDRQETVATLLAKYSPPPTGWSYHGLMKDGDRLAGAMTVIPLPYTWYESSCTFGSVVDVMVDNDARRDMFAFKKMFDAVIERMGNEVDLFFAVPNENSYLYFKKFLKWHDVGDLYYYVMPVSIGAMHKKLGWLNPLTQLGSMLCTLSPQLSSSRVIERPIQKISSDAFRAYRFGSHYRSVETRTSSIDSHYVCGEAGNSRYYYRLFDEDDTRVCYIVDIEPLTARALDTVASRIRRSTRCDAIIYIDSVKLTPHKMIRVPRKWEPRHLHLIAKTVTDRVNDTALDAANWQFNLSDFDVR